jgi:hypothetical protein
VVEVVHLEELLTVLKILEYSLFQPGLFLNYFSYPHKSAEYFHNTQLQIDFENRRAIVVGEGNSPITLTTVQDLAVVVADAVEFEGEWPVTGGICGGASPFRILLHWEKRSEVSYTISFHHCLAKCSYEHQ